LIQEAPVGVYKVNTAGTAFLSSICLFVPFETSKICVSLLKGAVTYLVLNIMNPHIDEKGVSWFLDNVILPFFKY